MLKELEHLNYLKGNSIYDTGVNLSSSDKTIILQTCNYDPVNTFILIILKKRMVFQVVFSILKPEKIL